MGTSMEDQADKASGRTVCLPLRCRAPAAAAANPSASLCPMQFREQKKNNSLLMVAASRGYLADVSLAHDASVCRE